MAPNVLANRHQLSLGIKESGGVQAARLAEDCLLGAQKLRQPAKDFRIDAEVAVRLPQTAQPNRIDRRLATNAATRRGKEVPLQTARIEI